MALNLFRKINSSIIQNFENVIYGKKNLSSLRSLPEELVKTTPSRKEEHETSQPLPPSRAEQPTSEANLLKQTLQNQQLQPALLPEYYKPPIDLHVGTYPNPPSLDQPYSGKTYRFEASNTYKNVTLPLKKPKLASPFPDPVKEMPSDTVSDEEKAAQMQADMKKISVEKQALSSVNMKQSRFYSTFIGRRSYATNEVGTDESKCKKAPKKEKKSCPKRVLPGCKAPKSIDCDRYQFKKCKKKLAPYPAYSEFCHTIPVEKDSECKLCPWKPNEHPHYKPKKKQYHTSAITFTPHKSTRNAKRFKAGQKRKLRAEKDMCQEMDNNPFSGDIPSKPEGMQLMKKKPCERPKNLMCEAAKKKKKKEKAKGGKGKKGKKGNKSKGKGKGGKKGGSKKKKQKRHKKAHGLPNPWITIGEPELVAPVILGSRFQEALTAKQKVGKRSNISNKSLKISNKNIQKTKFKKDTGKVLCKPKTKTADKLGINSSKSWVTLEEAPSIFSTEFQDSVITKNGLETAIEAKGKKGGKHKKDKKKKHDKSKKDGKKGKKKGKNCLKFPFEGCAKKKKIIKKKKKDGPCPKIRRKLPIQDCPGEKEDDKCKKGAPLTPELSIRLPIGDMSVPSANVMLFGQKGKDDKKKCPKVDKGKCDKEVDEDPCGLKRRGTTRKCPSDLLKKKRIKPKKPLPAPRRKSKAFNTASLKAFSSITRTP